LYKHKNKRGTFNFMMNSAKSLAIPPERVDKLLHSNPLTNVTPPLSAGALEAKANLERAQKLKEEQDMNATIGEQLREKLDAAAKREALNNTLNEWDQDEQKQIKGEIMTTTQHHLFQPTNNASRDTFNYVRDNPGLRVSEIKAGLSQHKESTVTTLVYQMVLAGLLRKDATGGFYSIVPEFVPFNINKVRREKKKEQQAAQQKANAKLPKPVVHLKRKANGGGFEVTPNANGAGIGALPVKAEPQVKYTFKEHAAWKPEDTVDTLTLMQAKAVHAYLQKLFGAL
jgi:hypothetical protein